MASSGIDWDSVPEVEGNRNTGTESSGIDWDSVPEQKNTQSVSQSGIDWDSVPEVNAAEDGGAQNQQQTDPDSESATEKLSGVKEGDFVAVTGRDGKVSLKKMNAPVDGASVLEDVDDVPDMNKTYPTLTADEWDHARERGKVKMNVSPSRYAQLQHIKETGSELFDNPAESLAADVIPFGGNDMVNEERSKIEGLVKLSKGDTSWIDEREKRSKMLKKGTLEGNGYEEKRTPTKAAKAAADRMGIPVEEFIANSGNPEQFYEKGPEDDPDKRLERGAAQLGIDGEAAKKREGETSEEYQERIRGLADERAKHLVSRQKWAEKELSYIDKDWKDTVFGEGRKSIGYSLEFAATPIPLGGFLKAGAKAGILLKAGSKVARAAVKTSPVAIAHAASDYEKFRENGYKLMGDNLVVESKGDDPDRALLKAIRNNEAEAILEVLGGDIAAPIMRGIGKVLAKNSIGKAVVSAAKKYGEIAQYTHFGDPIFEENLFEEVPQYFFSDVLGWGKKDSEYKGFYEELANAFGYEKKVDPETGVERYEGSWLKGDGMYTPKGFWNTTLAMLLQMGGQAAIAAPGAGLEHIKDNRDLANILEGTGMTKEQAANLSYRQREAFKRFHDHFADNPEKLKEALTRFDKHLGTMADDLVKQTTYKVQESIMDYGEKPHLFEVQSERGPDGKPVPKFESQHETRGDGSEVTRKQMFDPVAQVSIVDNGDGTYDVHDEAHPDRSAHCDTFEEAQRQANFYSCTNQKMRLDNKVKDQYARNLTEGPNAKYKKPAFFTDSVRDVYAVFSNAIRNQGEFLGVTKLGQIFETDENDEVLYPPRMIAGNNAGGFTTPNGTKVIIYDNVRNAADMNRLLSHEGGHAAGKGNPEEHLEMLRRASPDSEVGQLIAQMRQMNEELGGKYSDDYVLDEAFSVWLQQRGHNPSIAQRLSHKLLGKIGKLNDADFEVIASQIESAEESASGEGINFLDGGYGDATAESAETEAAVPDPEIMQTEADERISEEHEPPTGETNDETGHGANEAPAQPESGAERPAEGAEARPVAGAEAGAEAPSAGVVVSKTETPTQAEGAEYLRQAHVWEPDERVEAPRGERVVATSESNFIQDLGNDRGTVEESPLSQVEVNENVITQFKLDANSKGVVNPITGKLVKANFGFVVLWQPKEGSPYYKIDPKTKKPVKYVATGRHRVNAAMEQGWESVPSYTFYEEDGWGIERMKGIDAICNILDEKGTEHDYIRYFDIAKPSEEDVKALGLTDRAKGRRAYSIYAYCTDATRNAISWNNSGESGKITPEQARVIGEAAPKGENSRNEAIQRTLLKMAQGGARGKLFEMNAKAVAEELRTTKVKADGGEMQLDLFDTPETQETMKLIERRGQYRLKKANQLRDLAHVITVAIDNKKALAIKDEWADTVKEFGLTDAADSKQLVAVRDKINERADYWENTVRLEDADKAAMDAEINVAADARAKKLAELKAKREAAKSGKPAPKQSEKPAALSEESITNAIDVDRRDGLIRVHADNRFGDGSFVVNYAPGSADEIKGAAEDLRKAFPNARVLTNDDGIVVQPLPKASEKPPVSAPSKTEVNTPPKAEKPVEAKKTGDTAKPAAKAKAPSIRMKDEAAEEKARKQEDDVAALFDTPELAVPTGEDAAYMDAVKRGDMETAERMVREAAAIRMPNLEKDKNDGLPKLIPVSNFLDNSEPRLSAYMIPSMPKELMREIANWDVVSKSPYSNSFYNADGISWSYKPDRSVRVSDHWNFYSRGETHCRTDKPIVNGKKWVMAEYHAEDGKYHVLKEWDMLDSGQKTDTGIQYQQALDLEAQNEEAVRKWRLQNLDADALEALKGLVGKKVHGEHFKNGILRNARLDEWGRPVADIELLPSHRIVEFSGTDILYRMERGGLQWDRHKEEWHKKTSEKHGVFLDTATGQLKSADPVTYDDAGNVIPLSQRFDNSKADINFDTPELDANQRYLTWAKKWKLDPTKEKNQREWAEKNGVSFDSKEFDPELFQKRVGAVANLVKTYQGSGVADFKTLATRMSERFPEKFGAMKPYLRGVWNAVAEQMDLPEVTKKQSEEIYGIIENQGKETANGSADNRADGDVRPATERGERSDGVLADRPVREPNPDGRVDGERSGAVSGLGEGLADAEATGGGENAERGAAEGNGAVADSAGSTGGERDDGRDSSRNGNQAGISRVKKPAEKAADSTKVNPSRRDFVMTKAVEDAILEKKTAQRVRNNIEAIKLIRELKARDYEATPAEQETLAKFVGWGGLREKVFNYDLERAYDAERSGDVDLAKNILRRRNISQNIYDLHKELRAVLNEKEYESAKASASTAFYTPINFVRILHDELRNIGVKGGRFLGPSAGVGHFASASGEYEKPVNWQFVEKDTMTGEMLKALYPNQRVIVGGFEETKFPDGFFDIAIDNVPYADVPISDRSLSSKMFKIHDYFFAKTLAKLRPGGVMAYLTSTGTLDKTSPILRQYLTEHGGKIVGAVRLPNGFFSENAGTDAASDLVIVQKVDGRPDNSAFGRGEQYGTTTQYVLRKGNVQKPLTYNGYFKDNPGQVVGKMEVTSGRFGPTLKYTMPENADEMLTSISGAIERALDGIDKDALLKSATVADVQDHTPIYDEEGLRQGNVTMKDGKPFIKSGEMLEPIELPKDRTLSKELAKRLRTPKQVMEGLIGLRKAMRDVIDAQMAESDTVDAYLEPLWAKLNEVYDAFVKKNGSLHDKWVTPFVLLDKADGNRMLALERVVKDENGKSKIVKSDIFSKRVISRGQRATKAETPKDALVISYSESGAINVPRIAELLGVNEETAVAKLKESGDAFENPQTGRLEPSWEYLSGRVRAKLAAARAAVEAGEESYRSNVEALEKVQPPMVKLEDTEIKFGSTWVDTECMADFLRDALGSENMRVSIVKNEVTGEWNVNIGRAVNDRPWGDTSWPVGMFVERVLNHGSMNHYEKDRDGRKWLNERQTEANKLAAEKLHQAFAQFIMSNNKWAGPMYERYNAVMTDMVEIKLPNNILPFRASGMSESALGKLFENGDPNTPKKGREYQSAVISRGVLGGSSLCLAHCVGAGKTLEMQSIGMLGRRLGLFKKPMYVVPNHMMEQFTNEFMEAFPNANIIKMSEDDVKPENRRAFFAQVANGDWDAIIVKCSTFSKKLAMSTEYQKQYLQAQIDDMAMVIEAMRGGGDNVSVDQVNKIREKLQAKLENLINAENHDSQIVPFEELGVDQLFVDEAHNFKGLPIVTKQGRTGGLSQGDSQQAIDMQMKTEYIQSLHGGARGVVFATGTPLSNAPVVESYVILKYLAPNKLKEQGLEHFDDFVNAFGRITDEVEFSLDGKTVKEKTKVSAFVNIPELMQLFKSVVDIVNPDQLDIPRPKPKYHFIDVDMSPVQAQIMEMVAKWSSMPPSREDRNRYLALTRIAKNACTTPRLLGFEDGGNKIIRAVAEIKKMYDETVEDRGAQLVFTDMFNRSEKTGNDAFSRLNYLGFREDHPAPAMMPANKAYNLNEEIRDLLIQAGVPKDEIAIIQDIDKSKGDKDANKAVLFAKVRSGEVRVLIGSRPKMGEGTNVQERLAAIHLLHPGWKPAEDEQAIGRIIRFGNTYKEGQIFYYLTKGNSKVGSYETKNHQIVGVKGKLIDQVMHGDTTIRTIEMDEGAMDRDMLMGLASGNEALMELIDVNKRVHKLELNTESMAWAARRNKMEADATERELERSKADFEKTRKGIDSWNEANNGKAFAISTPDGRTIDKVGDMAQYVSAQVSKQLVKDSYDRDETVQLGNINGIPVIATFDLYGDQEVKIAVPLLGIERKINYSGFIPDFSTGAMTAFKNTILGIANPAYAKEYEAGLSDMARQAKKMSADADKLQKDYEGMRDELIKLRKRQSELERAVTPLIVQTVANHDVAMYGNWLIRKDKVDIGDGLGFSAVRDKDGKRLHAPTVKELIPQMDAEDFAHPGMGATKTSELRGTVDSKVLENGVQNIPANEVNFDTPKLYTGSAADYERPSLHKVGTGEGSQVYGWGLYGSTVREIAEGYGRGDVFAKKRPARAGHFELEGKRLPEWISDRLLEFDEDGSTYFDGGKPDADFLIKGLKDEGVIYGHKDAAEILKQVEENREGLRFVSETEGNIYEQTFFTDRAPGDESHLLKWYEPVTEEQLGWIERRLTAERKTLKVFDPDELGQRKVLPAELRTMRAERLYLLLSNALGSPRAASEFLVRAGIDGVKYPVDSYGGKTVKDGEEAGWNYVSFRDDNIRVDHKWTDGVLQFDTPELTPAEAEYAASEDKTPTEKVMREVYGMTNDEIATAMRAAGMEPPPHVRKSDEDMWKQAETLLSNPSYMAKLSRAVAKFPRPIRDYENAALSVLFRERHAAVNDAQIKADAMKATLDEFNAIPKDERDAEITEEIKNTADEYAAAKARLAQAKAMMNETGKAMMLGASKQGSALRSNRILIDQHDLTYAGISGQIAQIVGGAEKITPEMDAQIREIAKLFEGLDAKSARIATERLTPLAQKVIDQAKNGLKIRKATERKTGDEAKRVARNYQDALNQIEVGAAEVGGTLIGMSDQQYPGWGKWLKAIGEFHCFENPNITEEECINAIVEDISPFVDADANQVRDILTGFGHNFKQSRYDSQRLMNDLKAQARLKRQMDWMDETNTMPPLTGLVRDEPSDTTRNLQKQVQGRKAEVPDAGRDERRLKGVLDSIKKRLENKIEELKRAIETGERIPAAKRKVIDDLRVRELRAEKDEWQKKYDDLFGTTRTLTPEQKIAMAEKVVSRMLEADMVDLDRARQGDFSKIEGRPAVTEQYIKRLEKQMQKGYKTDSPTLQALREKRLETLRSIFELKKLKYKFGMTPEEIAALNARKLKNRQDAINRLVERIATGDLRTKKPQPPMTPEQQKQYDELGEQMKRGRQKLADLRLEAENATVPTFRRKAGEFVRFVTTAQRALRATMDFSAVLRQAARMTLAHPVKGVQAFGKAWTAARSEASLQDVNDEIMADPLVQEAVNKFGLHLREVDATKDRDVEMFHGMERNRIKMFGKEFAITDIPFFGEFMLKSERHYLTYLNAMSADLYTSIVNGIPGATAWQKKMVADMINIWNGSAALSKERRQALQKAWVNDIFWAPQLAISRVQSAVGYDWWHPLTAKGIKNADGTFEKPSAKERKTVARAGLSQHLRSTVAILAIGALLKWLFLDDDDKYNFEQADWFEKMMMLVSPKIGNTTIDLTGGESTFDKLVHQIVTKSKRSGTGRLMKFGEFNAPTVTSAIGRYLQGKLAPSMTTLLALWEGKDFVGDEFTPGKMVQEMLMPLTFEDVKDQVQQNGVGKSLLTIPLTLLGAGGSTYDRKPYENAVNRFLESKKEFDTIDGDELLDDESRKILLDNIRASNPLMRDEVREDIAADIARIRKDEARARKDEKLGEEADAELLSDIERGKEKLVEKIRAARH